MTMTTGQTMDKRLFVAETPCKRLDLFLSEQTDEFTRSRIKKLIEEGNVTLGGKVTKKAGTDIKTGDVIDVRIKGVDLVKHRISLTRKGM